MPSPEVVRYALAGGLSLLLLWAAISDVRDRRIPNAAVLAALALFVVWVIASRGQGLGSSLAAAAISFGVGYVLYLVKVMGAGDVKLFAALALFTGLAGLPAFALATALIGGLMAVFSLATRPRRAAKLSLRLEAGGSDRGVPYGVAISGAAAFVLWSLVVGVAPGDILQLWS
jgi:prepilin peptidase CpaA